MAIEPGTFKTCETFLERSPITTAQPMRTVPAQLGRFISTSIFDNCLSNPNGGTTLDLESLSRFGVLIPGNDRFDEDQ
jgi:hypothetical protein